MPSISVRKLAILALLEGPDAEGAPRAPIVGTTRLQKLLFLAERSLPRISSDRVIRFDFRFEPYRFGPADLHLYQDLEFLLSLGHISKIATGEESAPTAAEETTERSLGFGYLMGDEDEAELFAEVEGSAEVWSVTSSGQRVLASILGSVDGANRSACDQVVSAVQSTKVHFGAWPIPRLLRHVYSTFPDMTTSSEIRERVLGHD